MSDQLIAALVGGLLVVVPTLFVTRMQINAATKRLRQEWQLRRQDEQERRMIAVRDSSLTDVYKFIDACQDILVDTQKGLLAGGPNILDVGTRLGILNALTVKAMVGLGSLGYIDEARKSVYRIDAILTVGLGAAAAGQTTSDDDFTTVLNLLVDLKAKVNEITSAPVTKNTKA